MTQYDNELRGSLFKNDKEGNDARPDYTGTVQVDGKEYRLAAWIKEAASGKKYMSLKLDPKEGSTAKPSAHQQAKSNGYQQDDDVPF